MALTADQIHYLRRVVPLVATVSSRVQCERIRAALRATSGAAFTRAGALPRTCPA